VVDFKRLVAAIGKPEPVTHRTSPEEMKNNQEGWKLRKRAISKNSEVHCTLVSRMDTH
jgi:hypothetical protein